MWDEKLTEGFQQEEGLEQDLGRCGQMENNCYHYTYKALFFYTQFLESYFTFRTLACSSSVSNGILFDPLGNVFSFLKISNLQKICKNSTKEVFSPLNLLE